MQQFGVVNIVIEYLGWFADQEKSYIETVYWAVKSILWNTIVILWLKYYCLVMLADGLKKALSKV